MNKIKVHIEKKSIHIDFLSEEFPTSIGEYLVINLVKL